ncbi:FMN-binding protein [Algivirga pacifica]|uniref:FMN-binding domain-containing protein n=1 Tax=Algivirga pacifica TaxID=1162670 RepID=A0ABP9DK83_9BACT
MKKHLRIDYRKSLITVTILGVFVFFGINGSINEQTEALHFETLENEFFPAKLVLPNEKMVVSHGILSTGNHGIKLEYGLLTPGKKEQDAFGLLSSGKEVSSLHDNEWAETMEQRLFSILGAEATFEVMQQEEFCFAEIYEKGRLVNLYVENYAHNKVQGYAGPIYVGAFLDLRGEIEEVRYLTSKETESYLRKISRSGYYEQYKGIALEEESAQVDAISGATITTKAVAESVTDMIGVYAPHLDVYYASGLDAFLVKAELTYIWIIHLLFMVLIVLLTSLPQIKKTKRMRLWIALASLGYLGFTLNSSFTYITYLQPFMGTELSLFMAGYALLTLLGAIWGKNIYCIYICPFGAAQIISLRYSPFKNKKLIITNKQAEYIRYGLTLVLIAGFVMGYRDFGSFELFPDLFGLDYTSYWFFLAVFFVVISMRFPMLWCRVTCPTGCVLDTLQKISEASKSKNKKTVARPRKTLKKTTIAVIS